MKRMTMLSVATIFALTSAFALSACEVNKTDEGELPDVDVSAQGGDLPNYDVETPEVDVDVEPVPVTVPDVDVDVETPDEPDNTVTEEQDSSADDY